MKPLFRLPKSQDEAATGAASQEQADAAADDAVTDDNAVAAQASQVRATPLNFMTRSRENFYSEEKRVLPELRVGKCAILRIRQWT